MEYRTPGLFDQAKVMGRTRTGQNLKIDILLSVQGSVSNSTASMHHLTCAFQLSNTTFGNVSVYNKKSTIDQQVVVKSVNLRFARAMKAIEGSGRRVTERAIPERDMLIRIKTSGGHPNVVDFKDVHYDFQQQMYLEMEFCSQGDLLE